MSHLIFPCKIDVWVATGRAYSMLYMLTSSSQIKARDPTCQHRPEFIRFEAVIYFFQIPDVFSESSFRINVANKTSEVTEMAQYREAL
jgi:hypothetical protein